MLLFEIWSLGHPPFPELTPMQVWCDVMWCVVVKHLLIRAFWYQLSLCNISGILGSEVCHT